MAALLRPQIRPVFSVVAPCPAGASPPSVLTGFMGRDTRRRLRYRGSNPRAFHDKYKELNPERYADEAAKVVAAGKTPAGTHRPVMVQEIMEILAPKPGDFAVDATMGYGGHTAALLEAVRPGGRVLALDVDPIRAPEDRSAPPRDGRHSRRVFGSAAATSPGCPACWRGTTCPEPMPCSPISASRRCRSTIPHAGSP